MSDAVERLRKSADAFLAKAVDGILRAALRKVGKR